MDFIIQFLLLLTLSVIVVQDFKDRKVWVFLLPLFAALGSYLFFVKANFGFYSMAILINLGLISIVILLTYLYATVIVKNKFLQESIGLGDILFFAGFAFSFPTLSFLNFFVFSILFTLVFHKIAQKFFKLWHPNAPLAGCMSLFLIMVYLVHWLGRYDRLYYL